MKNRNRIIICLLVIGITLFAAVQFIVIPHNNAERNKYLAAQQEPATHDLGSILKYKNKYMGNSSNDTNLLQRYRLEYRSRKGEKLSPLYNSTAAFALIDNLKKRNNPNLLFKKTFLEAK